MVLGVLGPGHGFEVLRIVILTIAIDVMADFVRTEVPTQLRL